MSNLEFTASSKLAEIVDFINKTVGDVGLITRLEANTEPVRPSSDPGLLYDMPKWAMPRGIVAVASSEHTDTATHEIKLSDRRLILGKTALSGSNHDEAFSAELVDLDEYGNELPSTSRYLRCNLGRQSVSGCDKRNTSTRLDLNAKQLSTLVFEVGGIVEAVGLAPARIGWLD